MAEHDWLAERFEENRAHLRSVAYRMLGSLNEADDAVQESWIRLARTDTDRVENLSGWLTTVVARVCLDMLRSRASRGEEPMGAVLPLPGVHHTDEPDPEQEVLLSESVGVALLVLLDTLTPAERLVLVLHDMFGVPFDAIGEVLGRSPAASRQLASRARRRIRATRAAPAADVGRQRRLVKAFLAAARDGDFDALVTMLDPEVVLRADQVAVRAGADAELRGAVAVAGAFSGRADFAQLALVGGSVGAVWAPGGQPRAVFDFVVAGTMITAIELVAEASRLDELDAVIIPG